MKHMKPYFNAPLFLQKLIWIPTRLILIVFGGHKVYGLENLKGIKGPVIFACNHSSEIDAFMTPASLPFFSRFSPLFYAVREKEFYDANGWRKHLFNAWFISLWGGYGARVGLKDYGRSLERHIDILRGGGSFCVFPEGRITQDGKLQEGKGGISYLAHSAPCTIVPVGISGVYGMTPLDFFLRRRKTSVRFGKPIRPEDLYSLSKTSAASTAPQHTITQPTTPQPKNLWKEEAEYIITQIGLLLPQNLYTPPTK
jgi:1-acyl-sn-glycerol-3-phosphate acyltransferase